MIMKMLNKVAASNTPRWDMMMEIKKMQTTLDRMYADLYEIDATAVETEAMRGAITNLNYILLKLNNNRTAEAVKNVT
jgi:hypothetical protein